VFSGGEPALHPDLVAFIRYAAGLGINVMVVTNGGLLKPEKIHEMTDAGLSSLIISVDAASQEVHEQNRGLPGVCDRICQGISILCELGMHATASVTMSKLVDYEALPVFLSSLGFTSVVFSYPLTHLRSFDTRNNATPVSPVFASFFWIGTSCSGGAMPGMNRCAPSMNSTVRSWCATVAPNA
jgi:Radical SAM superfamily